MQPSSPADMRVVYLVNFLAPDLIEICRCWQRMVGKLDILVSVPMERNRAWEPSFDDLPVIVQRTWTLTRTDRHPSGYQDVNYIHVPLDTFRQLRRLNPDVVVSAEMGIRSLMASLYCGWRKQVKHIVAVSTSEHIERSRDGRLRRRLRRWLLNRADAITYHGESCRQYLLGLGTDPDRLFPWFYAADPTKPYRGEILAIDRGQRDLTLLTVGQLIERKGVSEACQQIASWASKHPEHQVNWVLVGSGPLEAALRNHPLPSNMRIQFKGNCDAEQIRAAYRDHDLLLFPTLGDEWGLVVDEALHSGVVVIGSDKAQSCQMLIEPGVNGFVYDPLTSGSLAMQLDAWSSLPAATKMQMRTAARTSVGERTPLTSAKQITAIAKRSLQ